LDKSSSVKSHEGKGRMVVFCICPGNLASGGNPNYSAQLKFSCMVAPYSRESLQKRIKAIILGAPRKIPLAKDIGWVSERRYLQDIASQEFGEILLCKENGELLEGLVTNFFVVRKETRDTKEITVVQTAPVSAGVVWGTARKHVLEICSDLCIQVDESCPVPSDRDKWTEAFVTNRCAERL
jgi:branched-subunit amino acid aminotransferase/4-amino-4-deoxychorismate lyase